MERNRPDIFRYTYSSSMVIFCAGIDSHKSLFKDIWHSYTLCPISATMHFIRLESAHSLELNAVLRQSHTDTNQFYTFTFFCFHHHHHHGPFFYTNMGLQKPFLNPLMILHSKWLFFHLFSSCR